MNPKPCMHEHFDLIVNHFKYKCETFQFFIYQFVVNAKCNSWTIYLTTSKVNDSTHVKMLTIQNMW
jgi:hypothetical protein